MSFWYLGSCYSKFPEGLCAAHVEVCREAARLIMQGVPVYSPIAHAHPIAMIGEVDPLDHSIWLPADKPLMDAAKGLIVLRMEGWEESAGLKYEILEFKKAGKPIVYMKKGDDIRRLFAAAELR